MSDRDEFGAFLVGFVVGGLTGAVVALLFAPQSGEQLAADARTRAEELTKEARTRATELASEVRERGKGALDAVRSKAGRKSDGSEAAAG